MSTTVKIILAFCIFLCCFITFGILGFIGYSIYTEGTLSQSYNGSEYSFNFPKRYILREVGNAIDLTHESSSVGNNIAIEKLSKKYTDISDFYDSLDKQYYEKDSKVKFLSKSPYSISGVKIKSEYKNAVSSYQYVVIERDGTVYFITASAKIDDRLAESTFDQIVNSFKLK